MVPGELAGLAGCEAEPLGLFLVGERLKGLFFGVEGVMGFKTNLAIGVSLNC